MRTFLSAVAFSVALSFGNAGTAAKPFTPPSMPDGYQDPGSAPEDPIGQILEGLRQTLADPYSIRDFSICRTRIVNASPPVVERDTWRRAYRVTIFQLNAKNRFGGYTGLQDGAASWDDLGRLAKVFTYETLRADGKTPPAALEARGSCTRISDGEVQRRLE